MDGRAQPPRRARQRPRSQGEDHHQTHGPEDEMRGSARIIAVGHIVAMVVTLIAAVVDDDLIRLGVAHIVDPQPRLLQGGGLGPRIFFWLHPMSC